MKKIQNIILLILVMFAVISNANATLVIHDNSSVNSRTNFSNFTCAAITPIHVCVNPTTVYDPNTVFVAGAPYDFFDLYGDWPVTIYTFFNGQPGANVYFGLSGFSTDANGVTNKSDGAGVTLNMEWLWSTNGSWYYPFDRAHPPSGEYTFNFEGKFYIKCRYTGIDVAANATPGEHDFAQTIEGSYTVLTGSSF